MQQLEKNPKWAVESTVILLQVADSISCLWLWFLLVRWIDSELFSLYALVNNYGITKTIDSVLLLAVHVFHAS